MGKIVPGTLPVCVKVVSAKGTPLLQGRRQGACVVGVAPHGEGVGRKQGKEGAQSHNLSC